ncbi:type II secretion system protein [bacterium]|nr:MAG: type II secretion system protein [bacterium]
MRKTRQNGFTIIELLTVIAIIAILSAIAFPVFARAKDSAFRSSDISKMNALRNALQLYKADQGAYPPALLGYATGYSNFTPSDADIIPANQVVGALVPRRLDGVDALKPSLVRANLNVLEKEFTTAVWPKKFVDTPNGETAATRYIQRFDTGQGPNGGLVSRCVNGDMVPNYYYRLSGFDSSTVRTAGGDRNELRYTLFWTGYSVPAVCNDPDATGSGSDSPRQLGYTDPPDSTVVTWNSLFRDYDQDVNPTHTRRDIVLFLGGGARPYDSFNVAARSWQVLP